MNGSTASDGLSGRLSTARAGGASPSIAGADAIGANRSRKAFHHLLAEILEDRRDLTSDLVEQVAGDADSARLGQGLQPGGDIDSVPVDVGALADDIAEVNADAQKDWAMARGCRIGLGH